MPKKITMQMLLELIQDLDKRLKELELSNFHEEWQEKINKLKKKEH
jgi:hypothetical protein